MASPDNGEETAQLFARLGGMSRLKRLQAELEFRQYARQLIPTLSDPPDRWEIAAHLCHLVNLQPNSFRRMGVKSLIPFVKLAIEIKTCKPAAAIAKLPLVALNGQGKSPIVSGRPADPLTTAQYNVIQALIAAGEAGLNKDQLVTKSGHSDARGILSRLSKLSDWKAVILLPRQPGGRYRIAYAPTNPH